MTHPQPSPIVDEAAVTSSTFETEGAARKYIADFWRGIQGEADIDKFKVVPVVVRVSALSLEQGETAP